MYEDITKYEIFIDVRPHSGFTSGTAIVWPKKKEFGVIPESDFFVPVLLHRTEKVHEYVDTKHDETIEKIQRQEFNPFFIEFGFFDNISRNKINAGSDLSKRMSNFIRDNIVEVSGFTDEQIVEFFDSQGKNEMSKLRGNKYPININDIERVQIVITNIVSKANAFPIDINT